MTMTAEQLARLREVAANLKDVARHSVDGYGRQDIHYNDPEGEFVFYSDYAALLDELERYKSREERVTKLVLDNSTSWDALYKKLEAAEKRIAELEARTVTVKLPKRATADKYVDDDFDNSDLAAIYNACRLECEVKFKDACAAAGINLTVEG